MGSLRSSVALCFRVFARLAETNKETIFDNYFKYLQIQQKYSRIAKIAVILKYNTYLA